VLSDLESVIASIENQDPEVISKVKDNWQKAFKNASSILCCPENFIVEYNLLFGEFRGFPWAFGSSPIPGEMSSSLSLPFPIPVSPWTASAQK
jgi:hypothetical protein